MRPEPWNTYVTRCFDCGKMIEKDGTLCLDCKRKRIEAAAPELLEAAKNLIDDVRFRYPGEDLRCPFMQKLDEAVKKAEAQP